MQGKIGDSIIIIGNATKDAEFKHIGEKQSPNAKWGVAIGKDKDDNGIFVNCEAWRRLAYVATEIKKGDIVMVIGKVQEREYNEKTYRTLVADWVEKIGSTREVQQAPPPQEVPQEGFSAIEDSGDLPF